MSGAEAEATIDRQNKKFAPSRFGWSKPTPHQRVSFGMSIARSLPEAVETLSVRHAVVVTTNSLAGPVGEMSARSRTNRRLPSTGNSVPFLRRGGYISFGIMTDRFPNIVAAKACC